MISVIIPHLNQPEGLEACLRSLDAQTLSRSLFEIIVVDNGSATPPEGIVAHHVGVRLLHEIPTGARPCSEYWYKVCGGRRFRIYRRRLPCTSRLVERRPADVAFLSTRTILGGDVRIWRSGNEGFTAIEAYESVFAYRFKLYIEQHGFSGTGNLVMFRSDFGTIGPFAGIDIAEDMEWGQRACSAGFQFGYVPDMIVFHPARRSIQELYAKWDRQIQHYLNMAQDKPAWRFQWIARALLILGSPIIDTATVFNSDRIQGVPARIKAVAVLCKIRAHRAFKMLSLLHGGKSIVWNRDTG